MLALLTPFLSIGSIASSLAKYWYVLVIGAVVAALGVLIWSWDARGKQIDTLNQVNATLQANLATQQELAERNAQTVTVMTERLQAHTKQATKLATLSSEIAHAPVSNDGPIAPVLRDALVGLRQQQAGGSGQAAQH